eukprot:6201936-Pleurochrysis_carterae.AAC.1
MEPYPPGQVQSGAMRRGRGEPPICACPPKWGRRQGTPATAGPQLPRPGPTAGTLAGSGTRALPPAACPPRPPARGGKG